jgi:mono/diheme cytochrome c family protein
MEQIVDLEDSPEFQALGLALISIAIDPVSELAAAARQSGITTPLLSDRERNVSDSYGVLRWAMPNGEPGHTFVLVGKDGRVKWIRDYGAPENGGRMYVPVPELFQEIRGRRTATTPGTADQLRRGGQLYAANCQSCHGSSTGGSMMDIPPPHNANGHTWHHPDCQLVETVLHGSGEMGEMMRRMMGTSEDVPRMPAFEGVLSEDDIKAILAHIRNWWTEEQRGWQSEVTRQGC